MSITTDLLRYDPTQIYAWNYAHPPDIVEMDVPKWPGEWDLRGLKVALPRGIAEGPL